MREWTLKGYLLSQLQMFSDYDGVSLYAFSDMARNDARLQDALCMYLMLYVDDSLRSRLMKKYAYLQAPCQSLAGLTVDNVESFFDCDQFSEYQTVYSNYCYLRDRGEKEDKLKRIMYQKIVERQREKNLTNYRIYTQLRLNPGNINAFLKNGDVSKVSLDTTRQILAFVNES